LWYLVRQLKPDKTFGKKIRASLRAARVSLWSSFLHSSTVVQSRLECLKEFSLFYFNIGAALKYGIVEERKRQGYKLCCGSGMIFVRIRIWIRRFRWFRILHEFFYFLNTNFTFVFPSYKCIRLQIMTGFLGKFCFKRNIYIFKLSILLRNCQILSVFRSSLLQIHFRSGDARIRNDYLRIRIRIQLLLKVSDTTGSG
jgi:hypothetical protein